MSDKKNLNVEFDIAGGMFVLGIFLLIILFYGEPDLHGAIIHKLMASAPVP